MIPSTLNGVLVCDDAQSIPVMLFSLMVQLLLRIACLPKNLRTEEWSAVLHDSFSSCLPSGTRTEWISSIEGGKPTFKKPKGFACSFLKLEIGQPNPRRAVPARYEKRLVIGIVAGTPFDLCQAVERQRNVIVVPFRLAVQESSEKFIAIGRA